MSTRSTTFSFIPEDPIIKEAFEEWKKYKDGSSPPIRAHHMKVVVLAKEIIASYDRVLGLRSENKIYELVLEEWRHRLRREDHPLGDERVFANAFKRVFERGNTYIGPDADPDGHLREHPAFSPGGQELFYKILSRAARAHFDASEPLFSPIERFLMVDLLRKFSPSKMPGLPKQQMVLMHRAVGEMVINRLAWNLLVGPRIADSLSADTDLGEESPPIEGHVEGGWGYAFQRFFNYNLGATSVLPVGAPQGPFHANGLCLRSFQELSLYFITMVAFIDVHRLYEGGSPFHPTTERFIDQYCKEHSREHLMVVSLAGALCLSAMLDGIRKEGSAASTLKDFWHFTVCLPLKEVLHLSKETSPAGSCLQIALATHEVSIEEDLSNFETYLTVLEGIRGVAILDGLKARQGRFIHSEGSTTVQFHGVEKFSAVEGPANRALYEAAASAIDEYRRLQPRADVTAQCVRLCKQLVLILSAFVENPSLPCPLILANDPIRLNTLIECAILTGVHAQSAIFTDGEKKRLKQILARFCADHIEEPSKSVLIEGPTASIVINKNLLMLFFEEYVRAMYRVKPQEVFEKIIAEGLLRDGMEALYDYVLAGGDEGVVRSWTARQALQVASVFQQMSCDSFAGKAMALEMVRVNAASLKQDPEIAANPTLNATLLTIIPEQLT